MKIRGLAAGGANWSSQAPIRPTGARKSVSQNRRVCQRLDTASAPKEWPVVSKSVVEKVGKIVIVTVDGVFPWNGLRRGRLYTLPPSSSHVGGSSTIMRVVWFTGAMPVYCSAATCRRQSTCSQWRPVCRGRHVSADCRRTGEYTGQMPARTGRHSSVAIRLTSRWRRRP